MEIIRSKYAGACYGVERALSLVAAAAQPGGVPVYTLGPLIHNPKVVGELRAQGVEQAASVEQADKGVLVIRSHGVAPEVIARAQDKGLQVVDATCPHVTKAHKAARELRERGYLVVVVGEPGHPEVEGIRAYAGRDAIIVQEPSDLPAELCSDPPSDLLSDLPVGLPSDKVGIVVQTTQSASELEAIISALTARGIVPEVHNTICLATKQRQEAVIELAAQVDAMVVVGGRNSSNTTRLAELSKASCPATYHIEDPTELDAAWFKDAEKIGVTAGASTPEKQIIAVEQALKALRSARDL